MMKRGIKRFRNTLIGVVTILTTALVMILYFNEREEYTLQTDVLLRLCCKGSAFVSVESIKNITGIKVFHRDITVSFNDAPDEIITLPDGVDSDAYYYVYYYLSRREYNIENVYNHYTSQHKARLRCDANIIFYLRDSLGESVMQYPEMKSIVGGQESEPLHIGGIDQYSFVARYSYTLGCFVVQNYPYLLLIAGLYIILLIAICIYCHIQLRQEQKRSQQIEMINYFCHDLKSPINSLHRVVESLFNESLPTLVRDNRIKMALSELDDISLDVEKLTTYLVYSQDLYINREQVYVADIIRKLTTIDSHDGRNVSWIIDVDLDDPLFSLDAFHFTHILRNLISNALRYSTGDVEIGISCRRIGDRLSIMVCDNGLGIASDDLPHIFKRGYRGNNHRHNDISSGLGLSYIAKVVSEHGGEISVESELGVGSRFSFTLK